MPDAWEVDAAGDALKVSAIYVVVALLVVVVVAPVAVGVGIYLMATAPGDNPHPIRRVAVGCALTVVGLSIIWFAWVPTIREHGYTKLPDIVDARGDRMSVDSYQFELDQADLANVRIERTYPDAPLWLCKVASVRSEPAPDPSRSNKIPESAQIVVVGHC